MYTYTILCSFSPKLWVQNNINYCFGSYCPDRANCKLQQASNPAWKNYSTTSNFRLEFSFHFSKNGFLCGLHWQFRKKMTSLMLYAYKMNRIISKYHMHTVELVLEDYIVFNFLNFCSSLLFEIFQFLLNKNPNSHDFFSLIFSERLLFKRVF